MVCICKHGERYHRRPAPFACDAYGCDCGHFRWSALNWDSPALVDLVIEASY